MYCWVLKESQNQYRVMDVGLVVGRGLGTLSYSEKWKVRFSKEWHFHGSLGSNK